MTPAATRSQRAYFRARRAYERGDYQNAVHFQELAAWLWIQEHYNQLIPTDWVSAAMGH
jgi:hypothetical protein